MATDPVCGMDIDEETAEEMGAEIVEHEDARYYFCSKTCRDLFLRDPERYRKGRGGDAHRAHGAG